MAIHEGSRYTNVYAYDELWKGRWVTSFDIRTLVPLNLEDSIKHTWKETDRLDLLAYHYYGDPQYWWFILDANPQYFEESEIKKGDVLLIPPFSELRKVIFDDGEE